MDASSGKLLNDFSGHKLTSYRSRACFGHNEASVVCGDENGQVWAWDLLDVSCLPTHSFTGLQSLTSACVRQLFFPPTPLLKFTPA